MKTNVCACRQSEAQFPIDVQKQVFQATKKWKLLNTETIQFHENLPSPPPPPQKKG
jgi:hypothetical protein